MKKLKTVLVASVIVLAGAGFSNKAEAFDWGALFAGAKKAVSAVVSAVTGGGADEAKEEDAALAEIADDIKELTKEKKTSERDEEADELLEEADDALKDVDANSSSVKNRVTAAERKIQRAQDKPTTGRLSGAAKSMTRVVEG